MTDPERFLDGDGIERNLLASASADAGSDAAYRRVQRAIGAALAVTGASTAAAAGTSAALATGKGKVVTAAALLKWLAIGATAGTVVSGAAYVALSPSPHTAGVVHEAPATTSPAIRAPVAPHSAAPAPPPVEEPEAVAPAFPSPVPAPAPPSLRERAREAPHVAGARAEEAAPRAAPAPALADEVRVLDAARAALAMGDGRSALAALARHRHEFPAGALQLEAAVLGVRALLETGQRAEAEREGARVLAAHPKGAYADRVRALLGASAKP